ncbi:glycosyltransferase family 2 protein [Acidithiobacillus ferrooxidans F221]|uniref:glycosyltransferase family 2 protein n=1 Tax=Acidithiobacillus ferrooxidans TaxID=920 RepID=UPI001C06A885|nr:glycosyltransferase family 2 protein [Acidithiobacillus ferrooxidans]MBU2808831.1 glycosyltransferase family 2 protein [Acidithiobacillus ferrooxidans F221]
MKQKISVVINTLNEEVNLPYALRSVHSWADELVVVDMYSEDRTVEIAKQYGAKIYYHKRIAAFDGARQFAIEQASNEWILILDADEEISPNLAMSINDIIQEDQFDVIELPRANLALSGFAPHESGFPEYHKRAFKKKFVKDGYKGKIHTFFQFTPAARITKITASYPDMCVRHYTSPTVSAFFYKINRYTSVEAVDRYNSNTNNVMLIALLLFRPLKTFFIHYVKRQGFRDGWRGFWLSVIFFIYELMTVAKIWEIKDNCGHQPTDDGALERMREHVKSCSRKSVW